MPSTISIPVRAIRKDDVFPGPNGWTALADAVEVPANNWLDAVATDGDRAIRVTVQYTQDGGRGPRVWDDPDRALTVER